MLPRLVRAVPPASLTGILPARAETPEQLFISKGLAGIAADTLARAWTKRETGP
jgi:hypothetical protein